MRSQGKADPPGPIDEEVADLIIFISRHASVHRTPCLTVHVTGNYETADLGGGAGRSLRRPLRGCMPS